MTIRKGDKVGVFQGDADEVLQRVRLADERFWGEVVGEIDKVGGFRHIVLFVSKI